MTNQELDTLLNKYYAGETSELEESMLSDFFYTNNISDSYRLERDQFAFFREERLKKTSAIFDHNVSVQINSIDRKSGTINISKVSLKIAASLIVGFAIAMFFIKINDEPLKTLSAGDSRKEVILQDGSIVSLNTNSTLRYPDKFGNIREVYLEGEAFFEVAKDLQKPFIIHTGKAKTEVLGTSFNIRSYDKEKHVEVTVVSGKVAFSTYQDQLQEKVFLIAGNQAIYNKHKNVVNKVEQSDANYFAWKTKQLYFDNVTLLQVTAVLTRYFGKQIKVTNKSLLDCHFKGRFKDPTIDEVLEVLDYTLNIKVRMNADTLILSGEGCK